MLLNIKVNIEETVLTFLSTLPPTVKTARMYAKRWKIEYLFLHLKTNGYVQEGINLKDADKNRLVMAIFAIAYTLFVHKG